MPDTKIVNVISFNILIHVSEWVDEQKYGKNIKLQLGNEVPQFLVWSMSATFYFEFFLLFES